MTPGRGARLLALALVLAARAADADEGANRVCLRFDGAWSAQLAALIESDLRTAFGRRQMSVCSTDGSPAERETTPLLTLAITGDSLDRVVLTLDPRDRPALDRKLDLTPFPPDGRVLALVVAADELLQAARDRPAEAPAPAATVAPPPKPAAPERAPTIVHDGGRDRPDDRQSLAAGFAIERYGGGQTQLGPDLTWRMRFSETLFVAVAGQARRGLVADAATGTVASRLVGGRLALGARLFGLPELTADLGVRGGRIWFEGEAAAGGPAGGNTTAGWLAYADATLALDLRLGGPVALRLAAGAGAPLVAHVAAEGMRAGTAALEPTHTVTAASGLALEAQAALLMVF